MNKTALEKPAPRKATNVTLPEPLLKQARALNVNVSQACERGLAAEVAEVRRAAWLLANRGGIDAWNERVEQQGLLMAEYRRF